MLSLSCAEPWPEGSVGLEEEVVTAAAQAEERDGVSGTDSSSCSVSLDDSLTSLQWLQEFSILGTNVPHHAHHAHHLFGHQQLGSEAPASPLAGDPASIGMPLTPGKPTAAAYSRMQPLPGIVAHGHCPDDVDYKTNAHIKPPYSYATLICMAMQASKKSKITLSCIYKWITDNFCYYRHADPTWQNSIRHNLSLNKCFIKVPRQKDEPGKGGFWKIDPQYAERLLSGAYKKRRMPPVQINPALQNRLRVNVQPQPRGQIGLCVNPESQRLLREFEEATGADQNWDPHLAEGTMLGSWPVVRGRCGLKRKQGSRNGAAKAPRRSSSPLLSMDEQKEIGPLKGDFDWDALLDSALSGELSLEGGEPLSPIMKEEDLTVRGTHISPVEAPAGSAEAERSNNMSDFDEETFLATAFLENPWPEEEEDHGRSDFLCSSTVNLDQLFGLEDSLGGDPSSRIDTLL
ncbi:forkhead box protein J1-A [Oreochromis aureus]|uniref:Fork-head domain-containing protein n=1 Tax=Oreochromis aureus TaxID=47969 RepID=A0A668UKX2_OREAU|nr:forkhead box protein J1-A [Oreochromis aureus]